ncbi:MAG: ribonuclease J [Candidatus Komeilibacteria bacterium CG_4_10_14_0_2_um_filter_37_10]|uniref:Ribonuclease J n=1 Tax=Candidatus Komeilibacteria bacterium CG_4_10_14_0_2_um_filter_37_10 TaxID=1974470 RepID=A0A2M7VE38_9BACT|nr:MAG: ribonuclease J [Candidatus Komeilibacteria bacterium CG_4_10_14_0_2_um_filter_37_10]
MIAKREYRSHSAGPGAQRHPVVPNTTRYTSSRVSNYQQADKNNKREISFGGNKLKIIVLGGNEEVGRNMTMLEYGPDIIIIDMGLQFPEEDMLGIDYIIPDTTYFEGKENNIRGVFITHAHYDHIGAIPHLIGKLGNPPIFSSDLSLKIIEKRQNDFRSVGKLNTQVVTTNDHVKVGCFEVEFFGVSHNIPTSMGLIIHTPLGIVIHTGDFKLDLNISGDTPTEITKIAKLGDKKVLALLSDSTNAPQSGHQLSEFEIQRNLEDIIRNAPGRLIVGTFASLLGRIQQIIWAAEKCNKKIIIEGFSMKSNVEIAHNLGYLKTEKGTMITTAQMKDFPNNRIVILCTGAQGEDNAVLMRIANKEHRSIGIEKHDTVVFSSSVIPGNERSVQKLKDSLYRQGAEVIHYQMMDIHAGGHAKAEDLKLLLNLVRPQYFIPIEGNHSFLRMHAKIAEQTGIDPKKIFVADNGQVMEFNKTGGRLTTTKVPADYVFVDGLGVGDVSTVVLRDRQLMAEDGMLVIIATIDSKTGELTNSPDIISRGFIYMKENKKMVEQTRAKIKTVLKENNPKKVNNDTYLKDKIRNEIGQFLFDKTERRPMILPVIIEV